MQTGRVSGRPRFESERTADLKERKTSDWATAGPWLRYAISLFYGFAIIKNYEHLSYWWEYIGFKFLPQTWTVQIALIALAAVPALFLPIRPKNILQLSAWTLHFTVFLPGLLIPPNQAYIVGDRIYLLFGLLLVSAIGFNLLSRISAKAWTIPRMPADLFWGGLLGVYVLLNGAIFYVFGNSLSIAGIENVYEQRALANNVLGSNIIVYAIGGLTGAINPFLIAYGVRNKNYFLVALGVASQVLAYASLAGKIIIFSTLVVVFASLIIDQNNRVRIWRMSLVFVVTALIGLLWLPYYVPTNGAIHQMTSILYMRTLYLPGVLIGAYGEFFSTFEATYLSHSQVGRLFTEYPYGTLSVGQVVGAYVTPGAGYDYNNYIATFIAGDGIASFGLVGVPIATAIGWVAITILDRIAGKGDRAVILAASLPFIILLSNSSIFTSLLTGGGILLALLLGVSGNLEQKADRG